MAQPLEVFGTDGIRGSVEALEARPVFWERVGWAVGVWLQECASESRMCLVAWDTRASGPRWAAALARGLARQGYTVQALGVAPSAALALTSVAAGAAVGLMVTASHNPWTDNGLKIIGPDGHKLTPQQEARIEFWMHQAPDVYAPVEIAPYPEGLRVYKEALQALAPELDLEGLPAVVDCAHGAAACMAPEVLASRGWHGTVIGQHPDGKNINLNVGSEHPAHVAQAVCQQGAPLGVAFDGDADRLLVCDARGRVLPGEVLLAILAQGLESVDACVTTHYSNRGLEAFFDKSGIGLHRVEVGDRHVARAMASQGLKLGAEPSGHILWAPHAWCADGLASALLLFKVLQASKRSLEDWAQEVELLPRAEGTVCVSLRQPFSAELQAQLKSLEAPLLPYGRLYIRYSGTQPLLRLLVEAPTLEQAQSTLHAAKVCLHTALVP